MRVTIKNDILKALLAKSGNRCSFPDCNHPIFDEKNLFIAQLAHIEAVSLNGPRFNSNLTIDQINSYDNLMFLCYRHHKEIDSRPDYTVDKLKEFKKNHENQFEEFAFSIPDKILTSTINEIEHYWKEIEFINKFEHVAADFKIDINFKADIDELFDNLKQYHSNISDLIDHLDSDFKHKYFETFCLGIPNCLSRSSVILEQLMIKFYEQLSINNPNDLVLKQKLELLRIDFKETAKSAGIAD
jgi:hypothetical protein